MGFLGSFAQFIMDTFHTVTFTREVAGAFAGVIPALFVATLVTKFILAPDTRRWVVLIHFGNAVLATGSMIVILALPNGSLETTWARGGWYTGIASCAVFLVILLGDFVLDDAPSAPVGGNAQIGVGQRRSGNQNSSVARSKASINGSCALAVGLVAGVAIHALAGRARPRHTARGR